MATALTNLSEYNISPLDATNNHSIAIVVSEWNKSITDTLLNGAVETLIEIGIHKKNIHVKHVPGSFELALGAQYFLQKHILIDAVICLGSVIKGETPHFDFVCQAVAQGIKDVNLKFNKPVVFGVLTDNTMQQAIDRSGGKHGNKGVEAAVTAIKMMKLKREIESLKI
jgi:6,7-dimethyl-8-ribityllumazine synthase